MQVVNIAPLSSHSSQCKLNTGFWFSRVFQCNSITDKFCKESERGGRQSHLPTMGRAGAVEVTHKLTLEMVGHTDPSSMKKKKTLLISFQGAISPKICVKISNYFTEEQRFHVQLQCHPQELRELSALEVGKGVQCLLRTPQNSERYLSSIKYLLPDIKSTASPMKQTFPCLISAVLKTRELNRKFRQIPKGYI